MKKSLMFIGILIFTVFCIPTNSLYSKDNSNEEIFKQVRKNSESIQKIGKNIGKIENQLNEKVIKKIEELKNDMIGSKNQTYSMSIEDSTPFDWKTVIPEIIVGFGTILLALATIFIVLLSKRTMEQSTNTQIKTTEKQIDAQNIRHREQLDAQQHLFEKQRISQLSSENRQDWINTLRICVSEYLSLVRIVRDLTTKFDYQLATYKSVKQTIGLESSADAMRQAMEAFDFKEIQKEKDRTYEERESKHAQLYILASKIELLFDPHSSTDDEKELVNNIVESVNRDGDFRDIDGKVRIITKLTQSVLKSEWDRISTGQLNV